MKDLIADLFSSNFNFHCYRVKSGRHALKITNEGHDMDSLEELMALCREHECRLAVIEGELIIFEEE